MSGEHPWHDREWLYEQYVEMEKTLSEVAETAETNASVIHYWCEKHDIDTRGNRIPADHQVNDEERLRELHHQKDMSVNEISEKMGVSRDAIKRRMKKFGVEHRYNLSTVVPSESNTYVYTDSDGYEKIVVSGGGHNPVSVKLHHLIMCIEEDPYVVFHEDIITHHENGLRWDNRISNLQFMTHRSHGKYHMRSGDAHNLDAEGYNDGKRSGEK